MTTEPRCPKGKAVFKAIAPDGSEHFRSSARDYTHSLVVSGDGEGWSPWSFNGSAALAEKTGQQYLGRCFKQYRVVEVSIVEDRRELREV
jgi:hypothetical protein